MSESSDNLSVSSSGFDEQSVKSDTLNNSSSSLLSESENSVPSDWEFVNNQGEIEVRSRSIQIQVSDSVLVNEPIKADNLGGEQAEYEALEKDQSGVEATVNQEVQVHATSLADVAHEQNEIRDQDRIENVGLTDPTETEEDDDEDDYDGDDTSYAASLGTGDSRSDDSENSSTTSESISLLLYSSSSSNSPHLDSDNESDFVRLERQSSVVITESEGEGQQEQAVLKIMSTSASSVGSSFNFLSNRSPTGSSSTAPDDDQWDHFPLNAVDDQPFDWGAVQENPEVFPPVDDDANSDLPLVQEAVQRHYIHCNNSRLNLGLNMVVGITLLFVLGLGIGHWIGSARERYNHLKGQTEGVDFVAKPVACIHDKIIKESILELHDEARKNLLVNDHEQLQCDQYQSEHCLASQADFTDVLNEGKNSFSKQEAEFTLRLPNGLSISSLLVMEMHQFQDISAHLSEELRLELMKARETLKQKSSLANMQAERNEMQGHVHHLESSNPIPGEQLWASSSSRDSLHSSQMTVFPKAAHSISDILEMRQLINYLQDENAELKLLVGKSRYQQPSFGMLRPSESSSKLPLPVESQPKMNDALSDKHSHPYHSELDQSESLSESMQTSLPEMEVEIASEDVLVTVEDFDNAELDQQDSKMSGPNPVPVDQGIIEGCRMEEPKPISANLNLLHRNLSLERKRADMWRRLYLQLRNQPPGDEVNASICFHYLSQIMNTSSLLEYLALWNISGSNMDDFANLTHLVSRITLLHQNVMESLPLFWEHLSSSFQDLQEGAVEQESRSESSSDDAHGRDSGTRSKNKKRKQWSAGVKNIFSSTKAIFSNVTLQLQQTWKHFKNLWPGKDSVFSRMASQVSEFSKQMHKKAKKWFSKDSKECNSHKGKSAQVRKQGKVPSASSKKNKIPSFKNVPREKQKRQDTNLNKPENMTRRFNKASKAEKDIRSHTQVKEDTAKLEKTNNKVNKNLQKRFDKIVLKLSKMNAQRFNKMDQADLKDMNRHLQDFTKFQIKKGGQLQEENQAWLTCQQTWWSQTLSQNYVFHKGCQGLWANWQIVIAEGIQKKSQNKEKSEHSKLKGAKEHDNSVKKQKNDKTLITPADKNDTLIDSQWYLKPTDFQRKEQDKSAASESLEDWYLERMKSRSQIRKDEHRADWVFERATDRREQQNQLNSDWVFERAADHREQQDQHDSDWEFEQEVIPKRQQQYYHGSDWVFDQAHDQEEEHHSQHDSDWEFEQEVSPKREQQYYHGSDWVFDQAHDQEEEEHHSQHDSDWVFAKAGNPREDHYQNSADWMFKRAAERKEIRQNEHASDWIFELADHRQKERLKKHAADWVFDRGVAREELRKKSEEKYKRRHSEGSTSFRQKYGIKSAEWVFD